MLLGSDGGFMVSHTTALRQAHLDMRHNADALTHRKAYSDWRSEVVGVVVSSHLAPASQKA